VWWREKKEEEEEEKEGRIKNFGRGETEEEGRGGGKAEVKRRRREWRSRRTDVHKQEATIKEGKKESQCRGWRGRREGGSGSNTEGERRAKNTHPIKMLECGEV